LPFAIISGIGIFGIVTTTMLITTNVTSNYFKLYASIVQYLSHEEKTNDHHNNNNNSIMIMMGRHWTRGLYWIPKYVYNIDLDFKKVDKVNDIPLSVKGQKAILIVDNTIKRSVSDNNNNNNNDIQNRRRQQQLNPYYNMTPIAIFKDNSTHYDLDKYPYTSMSENRDTKWVEIRANANGSKVVWNTY